LKLFSGWSNLDQRRAFANRQWVISSIFGHQEWHPPKWGMRKIPSRDSVVSCPNESFLRKTSSDGIGIVAAGD